MTDIASGVAKRVIYKEEVIWGLVPSAGSAQYLRRVSSSLGLRKQAYESNEIRRDYQRNDMRHGVRSVEGSISGELSAGTYMDLMAAAVRKAWATVTAIASLTLTIAGTAAPFTITRSAGSWITDGIKIGDVVRITAGSFTTINLNNNFMVTALTATVITGYPLNGSTLVAEGPIASATLTIPGKKTYVPTTSHTDKSFAIEHAYTDITQSEVFSGCKVNSMAVNLPPTGLATVEFGFMGKDVTVGTSQYYTTPTAETTSGALAAVNGIMMAQGAAIALLTGVQFNLAGNMQPAVVVGQNTYAAINEGRVIVNGQATMFFQDATARDYFLNETEVSLAIAMAASPTKNADFIGFTLPRVKFTGGAPDDGEKGLVLTMPFAALYNNAGGAATTSEQSTLVIQDSNA